LPHKFDRSDPDGVIEGAIDELIIEIADTLVRLIDVEGTFLFEAVAAEVTRLIDIPSPSHQRRRPLPVQGLLGWRLASYSIRPSSIETKLYRAGSATKRSVDRQYAMNAATRPSLCSPPDQQGCGSAQGRLHHDGSGGWADYPTWKACVAPMCRT